MALHGKLERDVELKSSAGQFYNIWRKEAHKMPTISPNNIQGTTLHEGEWDSHGHVKEWNYTINGKAETYKERIEFDDANMVFTLHGQEGHLFERYKYFRHICKLFPKENGCLAKLTMEYEKIKEDDPSPDAYMDIFVEVVLDVDAHCQA